MLGDTLGDHNQVTLEIHLVAIIKQTQRGTGRP